LSSLAALARLFVLSEYSVFETIINWIFLNLNPSQKELPPDNIITTYFSSLIKGTSFSDRYEIYKDLLNSVRLNGIATTEKFDTILRMNIYSQQIVLKLLMDVQKALSHGGDMSITRDFDSTAIRKGFVMNTNQNFYSDVFSLYGFHFETIGEMVSDENNCKKYQFYIQRLSADDPSLTYEQSQLGTFSLRTDRVCSYIINVQYWKDGSEVFQTTGKMKQRFGKAKTQCSVSFNVEIPLEGAHETSTLIAKCTPITIFASFHFLFPPN